MIMFDDSPEIALLSKAGDPLHVQNPLAYLGHGVISCHVFAVNQRDSFSQSIQQGQRIMAGIGSPVYIEFDFYQSRVGGFQQVVEPGAAIYVYKLKIMIMISKADPRVKAALPNRIQLWCERLYALQRAQFGREPGQDDAGAANGAAILDGTLQALAC